MSHVGWRTVAPNRWARREPRSGAAKHVGISLLLVCGCFRGDFLDGLPCERPEDCGPHLGCENGYCGGAPDSVFCSGAPVVVEGGSGSAIRIGMAPAIPALATADVACPRARPGRTSVVVHWVAPDDGTFVVEPRIAGRFVDRGDDAPVVSIRRGGCEALISGCGDVWQPAMLTANAGEEIAIVVDGLAPAVDYDARGFELRVRPEVACDPTATLSLDGSIPLSADAMIDRVQAPRCGHTVPDGAPEAMYAFTPAARGRYLFFAAGDEEAAVFVRAGGCTGELLACGTQAAVATLEAGQEVLVGVEAVLSGDAQLEVGVREAARCAEHLSEFPQDWFSEIETLGLDTTDPQQGLVVAGANFGLRDFLDGDPVSEQVAAFSWQPPKTAIYDFSVPEDGDGLPFSRFAFDVTRACYNHGWTKLVRSSVSGSAVLDENEQVLLELSPISADALDGHGKLAGIAVSSRSCAAALETADRVTGTTADRGDAYQPQRTGACRGLDPSSGPDMAYEWVAPATGRYAFSTVDPGFDTILYARRSGCTGSQVTCNDDVSPGDPSSRIVIDAWKDEIYVVVVDGQLWERGGPFTLEVELVEAYP